MSRLFAPYFHAENERVARRFSLTFHPAVPCIASKNSNSLGISLLTRHTRIY